MSLYHGTSIFHSWCPMSERISWLSYFMGIAYMVGERSTCVRRHVGCVLVKDKRILATGYNGAPSGLEHCTSTGCLREKLKIPSGQHHEICRGIHAEQNAIIQAATSGTSILKADVYCTTCPCTQCVKMLINCGVRQIYYCEQYPDEFAKKLLEEAGIPTIQIETIKGGS